MINIMKTILSRRNFKSVDFVTLKTAMMLAALDGEVTEKELESFREMAATCKGCTPKSFAKLWEEALRSTGYLLIQSKILSGEDLVALFVREAEHAFVGEVSAEVSAERQHAFDILAEMAAADGDFSAVERQAIDALKKSVADYRQRLVSSLYSRGEAVS